MAIYKRSMRTRLPIFHGHSGFITHLPKAHPWSSASRPNIHFGFGLPILLPASPQSHPSLLAAMIPRPATAATLPSLQRRSTYRYARRRALCALDTISAVTDCRYRRDLPSETLGEHLHLAPTIARFYKNR